MSIASGTEKTLTIMVLEAPFGYRAELRGGDGQVLVAAAGPTPVLQPPTTVLVLSEVPGADSRLEAFHRVHGGFDAIQLRAAREFPSVALHLAGVDAVIIDDFETSNLTEGQREALDAYVSLGGSLLVAGGGAWSRTVGPLPPGLAPLRPSASANASLGPLADLVGLTTTATATVATGDLAAGRVVLAAPGGPPLVVQSDHGAGRVVQLAYDPLAEPIASDPSLQGLAWDQGLRRLASRWGRVLDGPVQPPVPQQDHLWASALAPEPWPALASWPRWGLGVLALYPLIVGAAAFVLTRRRRGSIGWMTLPLTVAVAAAAVLISPRSDRTENTVVVSTVAADGAVLTTTYSGTQLLSPNDGVALPPGAAASTVFSSRSPFRSVHCTQVLASCEKLDPLAKPQPGPLARGAGGDAVEIGVVEIGAERSRLRIMAPRWRLRTVQTVSVDRSGPSLQAKLRLVGASNGYPQHVTGTLTNRGAQDLHDVRAQLPGGQARVADVLAAGSTVNVDAPVLPIGTRPDEARIPPRRDEAAMFAAASNAFTAPDQLAVVAIAGPATNRRRVTVVLTVVHLEAAETFLGGSGGLSSSAGSRIVTDPPGSGDAVLDMEALPGIGPLSVRWIRGTNTQQPVPPFSIEAYNWTTGTWRTLPDTSTGTGGLAEAPLDDAELNNGLVRVRTLSDKPVGPLTIADLVQRSASETTAPAG